MSDNFFEGADDGQQPSADRFPSFGLGTYVAEIVDMTATKTKKNGPVAVTTFRILEASPGAANPVGSTAVHKAWLAEEWGIGLTKKLVGAVVGAPPAQVNKKALEEAYQQNALKGMKVRVEGIPHKSKKTGETGAIAVFQNIGGQTTAEAAVKAKAK